jgi:hypothetical protein
LIYLYYYLFFCEGSSPTEVLETMRNLIVELQVFKEDNDKLKNAATRIVRNKRSKDKKRSKKWASKNVRLEGVKGDSSSKGTPSTKDKTMTGIKGNK